MPGEVFIRWPLETIILVPILTSPKNCQKDVYFKKSNGYSSSHNVEKCRLDTLQTIDQKQTMIPPRLFINAQA